MTNDKIKKHKSFSDKMFSKLKLRFTLLVTGICSALLLICFIVISVANFVAVEMTIVGSIDKALSLPVDYFNSETVTEQGLTECSVIISESGNDRVMLKYEYLSDDEFDILVGMAKDGVSELKLQNRYYRIGSRNAELFGRTGTIYAIYDYTNLRSGMIMQSVVVAFSLLGFAFILATFTYMTSGLFLAPVHESIVRQKELIANAGHELKTPVTIINANLDVIRSDGAQTVDNNAKWLDNIGAQTKRMQSMITEFLELTSFESKEHELTLTEFNLGVLIEGSCLSFEATCFEKGVTLQFSSSENLIITSDESCWTKLAGILLDNAVKYVDDNGKIEVSVTEKMSKRRKEVTFTVANTGAVIPPEELKLIFERFHKVGTRNDSFGLGLAMAKAIVELLGGKISCVSENGLTTFTVVAPV